jgi:hypothetical protein
MVTPKSHILILWPRMIDCPTVLRDVPVGGGPEVDQMRQNERFKFA